MIIWNGKDIIGLILILVFAGIWIIYCIFLFISGTFKKWRKRRDDRLRKKYEKEDKSLTCKHYAHCEFMNCKDCKNYERWNSNDE